MPIGMIDRVGNFVTTMTKPDNRAPIIASEALCISGRTRMAYKRGKGQEARERLIEELSGTITWLYGVSSLNFLGDKFLEKILKRKGVNFDTGSDIMRRPFDNFMMNKNNYPKGFTPKKIAWLKGAKVISAVVLADLFIGCVVPKSNQALSRLINKKHTEKESKTPELSISNIKTPDNNTKIGTPSFTGLAALNGFTHIIENTNIGKLVATDIGIVGGRASNARKKEEALDIGVRDIGSMYFYYWARGDVGSLMNLIETGGKTHRRLDPKSVNFVSSYIEEFLKSKGGSMPAAEFREAMFGNGFAEVPTNLNFEKEAPSKMAVFMSKLGKKLPVPTEAIELDKFLDALSPEIREQYEAAARKMSELQPKRCGVRNNNKNQIEDLFKGGEINSPKFLHAIFDNFTDGIYKDEYKYVSHKSLYKHKDNVSQYIDDIIKAAKDGNIDTKLLKSVKNKNLMYNGLNFAAGFIVAVAFLSTLIPKIQYYITRRVTGKEGFPGSDEFGKQQNNFKAAA